MHGILGKVSRTSNWISNGDLTETLQVGNTAEENYNLIIREAHYNRKGRSSEALMWTAVYIHYSASETRWTRLTAAADASRFLSDTLSECPARSSCFTDCVRLPGVWPRSVWAEIIRLSWRWEISSLRVNGLMVADIFSDHCPYKRTCSVYWPDTTNAASLNHLKPLKCRQLRLLRCRSGRLLGCL